MQSKPSINKSALRSDLLQQLNQTSLSVRQSWSLSLQKNLGELLAGSLGHWGAYQALSNEPQLEWSEVSTKIKWCYPEVQGKELQFHDQPAAFQKSKWGVQEPVGGEIIPTNELQGVIVPGLGFTKKGFRLGRGQGYYDRTLSTFKRKKIAVCFELSLIEEMPSEPHDVLFNHIITESSIYRVDVSEGDLKWN